MKQYSSGDLTRKILDLLGLGEGEEFEIHKLRDGSVRIVKRPCASPSS